MPTTIIFSRAHPSKSIRRWSSEASLQMLKNPSADGRFRCSKIHPQMVNLSVTVALKNPSADGQFV